MKITNYKNAYTIFERIPYNGMYVVALYIGTELKDKMRCDTYRAAREYLKAFNAIARNA